MTVDRREVLRAVGLAGLAGLLPAGFLAACTASSPPTGSASGTVGPGDGSLATTLDPNRPHLVLDPHEAAVVEAARRASFCRRSFICRCRATPDVGHGRQNTAPSAGTARDDEFRDPTTSTQHAAVGAEATWLSG